MKKFLLGFVASIAATFLFSSNAENIYLVGAFNGWTQNDENYKFQQVEGSNDSWEITYVGCFYAQINQFKMMVDGNWYNIGNPNDGAIKLDTEYWLGWKDDGNGSFEITDTDLYVDKITVTKQSGGGYKAVVNGRQGKAYYVFGNKINNESTFDIIDWTNNKMKEDTRRTNAVLLQDPESPECYWGQIKVSKAAENDDMAYFNLFSFDKNGKFTRICPEKEANGENGTVQEDDAHTWQLADSNNGASFVIEPKQDAAFSTYSLVYDPNKNELRSFFVSSSDDITSGVEAVESEDAKVIGGHGEIIVNGNNETATVYSFGGAIVAQGKNNITVPAGLYITVIDGKATKVVVR